MARRAPFQAEKFFVAPAGTPYYYEFKGLGELTHPVFERLSGMRRTAMNAGGKKYVDDHCRDSSDLRGPCRHHRRDDAEHI